MTQKDLMKNLTTMKELLDECLDYLENASNDTVAEQPEEKSQKKTVSRKKGKDTEPAKTTAKSTKKKEADEPEYTKETLSEMSYNDLKKTCKALGISAVGGREEITNRILEHVSGETEDEEDEKSLRVIDGGKKDAKPAKKGKKATPKKEEPVEDEEDEEEPAEDEEEDDIVEQVKDAVSEMSNEEIADLLSENGLRAKGKREALIAEVIKGVREGVIDFEYADEEDEAESEEETEDDAEYYADFITEDMTEEREQAVKIKIDEIMESIDSETITEDQLKEWYIESFEPSKKELKALTMEDFIRAYIETEMAFIDDEGESHQPEEEEPYVIGGEYYCCGEPMTYSKKNHEYTCECCGATYEED